MYKISMILPVLTLLAAPAFAGPAATPLSFKRNGIDYVATERLIDGKRVIEGYEVASGKAFRLLVSGNRVTGDYAGSPMRFRVPAPADSVEVASR